MPDGLRRFRRAANGRPRSIWTALGIGAASRSVAFDSAPTCSDLAESPQLTSLLADVVAATITEQTGCVATIKPPNDIYVAGRKVAGVLVEGRTDERRKLRRRRRHRHQREPDRSTIFRRNCARPPASLAMATGRRTALTAVGISAAGPMLAASPLLHGATVSVRRY